MISSDDKRAEIISRMTSVISSDTEMKKTVLEAFMRKNPNAAYKLEEFLDTMNTANEAVIRGFRELGEMLQ